MNSGELSTWLTVDHLVLFNVVRSGYIYAYKSCYREIYRELLVGMEDYKHIFGVSDSTRKFLMARRARNLSFLYFYMDVLLCIFFTDSGSCCRDQVLNFAVFEDRRKFSTQFSHCQTNIRDTSVLHLSHGF